MTSFVVVIIFTDDQSEWAVGRLVEVKDEYDAWVTSVIINKQVEKINDVSYIKVKV